MFQVIGQLLQWGVHGFRQLRSRLQANLETQPGQEQARVPKNRGPTDHINTRILETKASGLLLIHWALEPERQILMFMWSFGPRALCTSSATTCRQGSPQETVVWQLAVSISSGVLFVGVLITIWGLGLDAISNRLWRGRLGDSKRTAQTTNMITKSSESPLLTGE